MTDLQELLQLLKANSAALEALHLVFKDLTVRVIALEARQDTTSHELAKQQGDAQINAKAAFSEVEGHA